MIQLRKILSTSPKYLGILFLLLLLSFNFIDKPKEIEIVFGVVDDTYSVNSLGAYNHIIPIDIPPGINGLQPKLSVTYDSRAGLSELGLGWSLSGISSIKRAGLNIAQHDKNQGISFSPEDSFLLDGQYLTLVKGNNGEAGSRYRTESESFKKIFALGHLKNSSSSPLTFVVKSPDGLTYTYGKVDRPSMQNIDSQNALTIIQFADDSNEIMEWKIKEIRDNYGNFILFNYEQGKLSTPNTKPSSRIQSIHYSGNINNGSEGVNDIFFRYNNKWGAKRRSNENFIAGVKFKNENVLEKIVIETKGEDYRSYHFEYDATFSRLEKVFESADEDNSIRLKPTEINYYSTSKLNFKSSREVNLPYFGISGETHQEEIDLDLDGLTENIVFKNNKGNTHLSLEIFRYSISKSEPQRYNNINPSDSIKIDSLETKYLGADFKKIKFGDFNNDGYFDFLSKNKLYINSYKKNRKIEFDTLGVDFDSEEDNIFSCASCELYVYDVNDDNTDDILQIDKTKKKVRIYSLNKDETSFSVETVDNLDGNFSRLEMLELSQSHPTLTFIIKNSNKFQHLFWDKNKARIQYSSFPELPEGFDIASSSFQFQDFNFDGLSDIYVIKGKSIAVSINKGSPSGAPKFMGFQKLIIDSKVDIPIVNHYWGNFTSSGLLEMFFASDKKKFEVYSFDFNNGKINVNPIANAPELIQFDESIVLKGEKTGLKFSDINGDGLLDLSIHKISEDIKKGPKSSRTDYINETNFINRVQSVKDGFGNIVNVKYTTTKDNEVYSFTNELLTSNNYKYFSSPYIVVDNIKFSNGLFKSTNTISYKYEDLIYETTGRGLSGFKKFTEIDNVSNIIDEKIFEYEFPLTGKIIRNTRKIINGPTFFQQTNSWATKKYKRSIDFILMDDFLVNPDDLEFTVSNRGTRKNDKIIKNYVRDITSNHFSNNWFENLKFTQISDKVITGDIVLKALPEFNKLGIRYLPYLKETEVKKWEINNDTTTISDSNISYTYNNLGNIIRKEMAIGDKSTIDSTSFKQLYTSYYTDPYVLGLPTRQKTYAINNSTKERTKPRIFDFEYNKLGKIKLKIREKDNDSLRHYTKITYDKFGNLLSLEKYRDPFNKIKESFVYSDDGRFRIKSTNSKQDTTQYEYDKYGYLKFIIDPNKKVLEKKYDRFGKLYKEILPNKNTKEYQFEFFEASDYEQDLIPKSAIYKLTTTSKSRSDVYSYYDSKGREVASLYQLIDTLTHPNNNSSSRPILQGNTKRLVFSKKLFDRRGNLSVEYDPRYVQITNRLTGSPCVYQEGDSIKTFYEYDDLNRLIRVKTPDGTEFSTTYEAKSKTEENLKSDFSSITFYNSTGEIEKILDSKNNPLIYSYDLWGNIIKIEGAGHEIITKYDHVGRKKYIKDSSIDKIEYFYDEFDRLIAEKNKTRTAKITYDSLSRVTTKQSDDRMVKWHYDKKYNGNTDYIEVFDGNGKLQSTEKFDYDNFGNVKKVSHTIDSTIYYTSFDYDQYYRVKTKRQGIENDSNSIMQLKYNYINDIVTSIHQISNSGKDFKKVYEINSLDALGNVRLKTYGNNVKTQIDIDDKTGLISSIQTTNPVIGLESIIPLKIENCSEIVTQPPLNTSPPNLDSNSPNGPLGPFGPRNNGNFHNQLANNAVQFSKEAKPAKNEIQDLKYFYDSNYNLHKRINHLSNTTDLYTYDGLNQLKGHTVSVEEKGISSTEYEINEKGNILRIDDKNFGYYDNEAPHRVKNVRIKHEQKLYGFGYDDFGNINTISKSGKDSIIIDYSSFNKPIKIKNRQTEQIFIYGSANQQIVSIVIDSINGNTTTVTPFTDFEIKKEGNNIIYRHYIVLNGQLIAINNKEEDENSTYYIHKDNLGSIDVITNDSGTAVKRYSYAPYGKREAKNGKPEYSILNKGFTGHEHLEEFGLINMGGRFYMPEIGRFLSADPYIQDPSNLQSLNRYSYVLNNPLNLVDPSGFWGIRIKIRIKVKWNPLKDLEKAIRNTGRAIAKAHEDVYNETDRFVNKYGKQIVMIAAAAAITYFSGGMASGWAASFWSTTLSGAAWGAGISATITAVNGGDFNDIMDAAFNGAILGATAAAAAYSIGAVFSNTGLTGSGGHILSHGVSGGLQSEINGGNFEEGFWSASISKAFVPSNEALFGTHPDDAFKRIAYSSAIGGLSSHVQGGNVMQGAMTAGFIQAYNQEQEYKYRSKWLEPGYKAWKDSPKKDPWMSRIDDGFRPYDKADQLIDAGWSIYEGMRNVPAEKKPSSILNPQDNSLLH